MTRSHALLPARAVVAFVVALGFLIGLVPPVSAAADDDAPPLTIHLSSVTPAAIPRRGPITISGTVTNGSDETWRSLSLYPLTSRNPLTTHEELVDAANSGADAVIGDRIVADGEPLGVLRPGESRSFTLVIRHRDLFGGPGQAARISGAPGVYWLGVHALGTGDTSGNDNVADGRARTFLPLVPARKSSDPVTVALVLPLRHEVDRTITGAVANADDWNDSVSSTGALGRTLAFAQAAGSQPLTWLADPEVLQAVGDLGKGNAGMGLAPASAGSSPSPSASATEGTDDDTPADNPFHSWLDDWTSSAQQHEVLALPYADTDVSAVAVTHLNLLQKAWKLGASVLDSLSVKATRAIAPVDGRLDPRTLDPQATGTTVLTRAGAASGSRVATHQGLRFAAADPLLDVDSSTDQVDVRQRILAAAAVRALGTNRQPVVAVLPEVASSDLLSDSAFFDAFASLGWVRLGTLGTGTPAKRVTTPWSARARAARIPRRNVTVATHLANTAAVATELFTDDGAIGTRLWGMALAGLSQDARGHAADVRDATAGIDTAVRLLLNRIQVEGSDFVTLSGDNGILTVALYNGLNKPIRVGLSARADDPRLKLTVPAAAELAAGRRTTLRLKALTRTVGVHEVRAQPVTASGIRIGRPFVFAVRTSQIGQVFWYVVLGGTAFVVLLIVRRARIRLRARRNARRDSAAARAGAEE